MRIQFPIGNVLKGKIKNEQKIKHNNYYRKIPNEKTNYYQLSAVGDGNGY